MLTTAVFTLSIMLQLTAAVLALRLMRLTRARLAWVFLAAALSLMAFRRLISLSQQLSGEALTILDLTAEMVALVISFLMVLGIAWIRPVFLSLQNAGEALRLNESRLQALWNLGQMRGATLQEIADFTLNEAVRLTNSRIGFLGFLNEDETQLTVRAWSKDVMAECAVQDLPLVYPLETAGLWKEAVLQRGPLVVNDYQVPHPEKKGLPEGHIPLSRFLAIPVLENHKIVVMAAVGNKEEVYDESDVRQLTLLLNGMWRLFQRQQDEAALTAEIERMHEFQARLIQTSTDGIIANDDQGNIILFNEGAEKILGYRREEVIGKLHVAALYHPGEARHIKKLLYSDQYGGQGHLVHYETVVLAKTGEEIPIELSACPILEDSREVAVVGFFRDLRERKQLQEKLLQSERLAVIGRMATHLGHEIKNPLLIIGGFARQVRDHLKDEPEKNREKLQIIINEIERLEEFLQETGSYARLSEPQKVLGEINPLIKGTCDLLAPSLKERQVTLHLQLADGLPRLAFDPQHIRQVLLNLLKNSLEAMPQGGELSVTTSRREDQLLVEIADTGEGMSQETKEKIFQPFFSTKPKGSGLGLAICQKIMEAHEGEIEIDSEPHQGTKVTLVFQASGKD